MPGSVLPVLLALALVCLACGAKEQPPPTAPPQPDVILVVLDSVRADRLHSTLYDQPITPHLDALAASGLTFDHAYAGSSNTLQSLSTLWTGRLPSSGGSTGLNQAAPHRELLTLSRLFLRAGYRTALVSNHPGLRDRGFTRGFDDVEVDSEPGRWTGQLVTSKALELMDQSGRGQPGRKLGQDPQGRQGEEGDQDGAAPLFLVVDFADAAEPHLPLQEYRQRIPVEPVQAPLSLHELRASAGELPEGRTEDPRFRDLVARYDAEVAYVDACLGTLVDGLAERGRLESTLLIVTSSHGVEFLEHGYVGSGWTLYDEVIRVPLVLHAPGLIAPAVESTPVSLADLVPSLQQTLGLEPSPLPLDGWPLLRREGDGFASEPAPRRVLSELIIPELTILRTWIEDSRKGISAVRWIPPADRLALSSGYEALVTGMLDGSVPRPDPFGDPVRTEVYELTTDPAERTDLLPSQPDLSDWLRTRLDRYKQHCAQAGLQPRASRPAAEMPDPEDVENLRSLGYL